MVGCHAVQPPDPGYFSGWILCALALLGLSMGRGLLDRVALALGIYYPPAVLLLVLIFFVFVAALSFSVVLSRQRQQIERLMEDVAILDAQIREQPLAREPQATPPSRSSADTTLPA